jgi:hypothetical protein
VILAALTILVGASPVSAGVRYPPADDVKGRSLVQWQRAFMRWSTGTADSPTMVGGCGAVMHGVYFLPPAAVPGVTDIECRVPRHTPILVLAGATFSEIPTFGADDEAIIADALATWEGIEATSVKLDGKGVSLAGTFRNAGAYDVVIEPGSFYDEVCYAAPAPCQGDFVPPGPVRLASVGEFVVLRPLPKGDHDIVVRTAGFGIELIVDAELHVRGHR